ncbi:hypothetical protein E9993_00380 [Labilibacter sediminis]|nr:hypothetical protein E9993_00380 [Labilibacter sediminis]
MTEILLTTTTTTTTTTNSSKNTSKDLKEIIRLDPEKKQIKISSKLFKGPIHVSIFDYQGDCYHISELTETKSIHTITCHTIPCGNYVFCVYDLFGISIAEKVTIEWYF